MTYYCPEAAAKAVGFIERLKHTKGEWAGRLFKLDDWQRKEIIEPIFGTLNHDGTRAVRTSYVEVPRKNGKSELAAAIALYILFCDDEPGAEIYSAAADRDQAKIVFTVAMRMVELSESLRKRCKIIASQNRIVYRDRFYRAIPSEAHSKHGYNAHCVIFDELHAQPNRDLWDVLTTSMGARRQPLTFAITTAGFDRNSICWEQHAYAEKVLDPESGVDDSTFHAFISAAPEDADWTDEEVWKQANPALRGQAFRNIEEMRMVFARAKETPALQNTARRLYLNQWTRSDVRAIDLRRWDACRNDVDIESLKGRRCYGGLDLASNYDIAAFVLVFDLEDGSFAVVPRFWVPLEAMRQRVRRDRVPYDVWVASGRERPPYIEATQGDTIDYGTIEERIRELAEVYDIQQIAFDRWGAAQMSQRLTDAGLKMVPFGQGVASMTAPTKEFLKLISGGNLVHFGNNILRWMADNLVTREAADGIKPDKSKSTEKIDGIVASIMALDLATRATEQKPSIYEERSLLQA